MMEILFSVAVFAIILLGIAKTLDEKHNLLKLLIICVVVIATIIIGTNAQFHDEKCDLVMLNETHFYSYGNNYTGYHWDYENSPVPPAAGNTISLFHQNVTYEYGYNCYSTGVNDGLTLYRLILGFLVVFFIYVVFYYAYAVFNAFKEYYRRK